MNRSELVKAVAERAGSDESAARRHVDAVFDTVMDRVSAGERVIVTGFGTFDSFARPARSARNPRTGLPVEVPAAQVPRFRTGQTFRNRVAGEAPAPAPAAVEPAAEPEAEVTVAVETDAPAAKKPKAGKNEKSAKDGKNGKKAKRSAESAKPSAKPEAAASAPVKDGKKTKNAKAGKKKAGKAKARAKAAK
ncbi:HU family DNA-binding protein [Spirillospora sp. NPDC047418]